VLAAILIAIGCAFAQDLLDQSVADSARTTQGDVRLWRTSVAQAT
jgi:hypothetical protein